MRKAPALAAMALALAGVTTLSAPADAQSVTFTLSGGSLSISEPGAATVTAGALSGLAGSAFTGSLGSTTVTGSGWTVEREKREPSSASLGGSSASAVTSEIVESPCTVTHSPGFWTSSHSSRVRRRWRRTST